VLIAVLATATYAGIVLVHGTVTLFAVWILWGVFWALASGATSAYCYELLAIEGRQDESVAVFGFMRAVASSAALVSHLAAGFLFAGAPALPFVANGMLALGAVGIALTLPDPPQEWASDGTQRPQSFRQFLALHDQRPPVFVGIILLALALIYFWSPRILMQPLFIELSISPMVVSAVYFFYSLAGVGAGLAMHPIQARMGTRPAILAGLGLLWLGVWLVALVPGYAALLFFPLLSFGYYLAQTLLEVVLHGQLENRHRASILSAASFMGGIVIIVTRPGLGMLADAMSAPFAFLVWAVLGVVIVGAFVALVRRLPSDQPAA
jgi:MFS family permease